MNPVAKNELVGVFHKVNIGTISNKECSIQPKVIMITRMANQFEYQIIKKHKHPNKIEPPVRFVPENVYRANGL